MVSDDTTNTTAGNTAGESTSSSDDDVQPLIRLRAELKTPTAISLKDSEHLADIFFICGDDLLPIKCHKLILRNWSSFLSRVVECSMKIQGPFPVAPIIVLKEIPGKDLQDILKFIYTGELILEQSRAKSILKTAKFLELALIHEQLEASDLFNPSK